MRIIVCGDRNWLNIETIWHVLSRYPKDTVVIHGAARGADSTAGVVAKELGFKVEEYPADQKTPPFSSQQAVVVKW